jgi:uncharacterized protein YndB with AHSA1/START domain
MPEPVSEKTFIAAPAHRVWSLVSDVTRMGEWSPETRSCQWKGGANGPEAGAKFSGRNRRGHRVWATSCVVTEADPGRAFAFRVSSFGMPIAQWSYEVTDAPGGCELTESTVDRRGLPMFVLGPLVSGVRERADHNRAGIVRTLAAIKAAAESD